MASPVPRGLRSAHTMMLLLSVGVVAAVAFLNWWLALAIGAGLLLGELTRRLLRLLARSSKRKIALSAIAVVGLLFVAAYALTLRGTSEPPGVAAPSEVVWPYHVDARYVDDHFVVREQVLARGSDVDSLVAGLFDPTLAIALSRHLRPMRWFLEHYKLKALVLAGASPAGLIAAGAGAATVTRLLAQKPRAQQRILKGQAAEEGWGPVEIRGDGFVVRHRPVIIKRSIRVWPLTTNLSLPIQGLRLGWRQTRVVPAETTAVDIFAKVRVFRRTSPPSSEEYWDGDVTNRHIVLGSAIDRDTVDIRFEANSILARNPIVERMHGWTVWTPILWLIALVSAIFSDAVKSRIKRLMQLGQGPEAAPTPPVASA